jgi:hypothetical protein
VERPSRHLRNLLAAGLVLSVSACLADLTDPFAPIVLETSLHPVDGSTVSGTAAIVSDRQTTEVGIAVSGLESGQTVSWRIFESRCSSLGEAVLGIHDHYSDLVGSASGTAQAEAQLNVPIQRERDYAVAVFRVESSEEPDRVVLACGSFRDFQR